MSISPSSSFQTPPPQVELPRSPAVANFQLLNEVSQIFGGESLQLVCELANRFHWMGVTQDQVQQIVQMLTLPNDVQLPQNRQSVSPERLLNILLNLTEFQYGVQQLIDLATLCKDKDWHLCFLQNGNYKFDVDSLCIHSKMLYIELPEDFSEFCNTATTNVATIPNEKLHIEQVKLTDLLGSTEKVDGYLVGHELSHATALAICYSSFQDVQLGSSQYANQTIDTFYDVIYKKLIPDGQQLPPDTQALKNLLNTYKVTLTNLLQEVLFKDGEEARNILGLGINESFDRGPSTIISEFDFLHEAMNNDRCTRIPYISLNEIKTFYPKLCMALLTLIFKIKEQSIVNSNVQINLNDPAMQNLVTALQEYDTAKQNMSNIIQQQLSDAGYRINHVRGDGNDGFYAILEALTPSSNPESSYFKVKPNSDQWQAAAQLRQMIAHLTQNTHLTQMTATALGTEDQQMRFDDLPAVAQYLFQNHQRPLVVINATAAPSNPMFTYYGPNGEPVTTDNFQEALNTTHAAPENPPIVLLYRLGHWDAVVPTPSQKQQPDTSCCTLI
jgi:hypothetical protein